MQKEDEKLKKEKQDAFKNGNAALIGSAGFAAMGTGLALGSSFICPVCIFATPALLGTGIYQKLKSKKNQREKSDRRLREAIRIGFTKNISG